MTRIQRAYSYISFVSAVIAIYAQMVVYKLLIAAGPTPVASELWVRLVAGTSAYTLLYSALVKVYEIIGWHVLLYRYNISGKWYHEFSSDVVGSAEDPYVRYGCTYVTQNCLSFRFLAHNYDYDFRPGSRSIWKSVSFNLEEDGMIMIAYEVDRARPGVHDNLSAKKGLMRVVIERNWYGRPVRMIGNYADSTPSNNRGAVTWMRYTTWVRDYEKAVWRNECLARTEENVQ